MATVLNALWFFGLAMVATLTGRSWLAWVLPMLHITGALLAPSADAGGFALWSFVLDGQVHGGRLALCVSVAVVAGVTYVLQGSYQRR